jgi:predicted nucleotidyltransferase
MTHTATTSTRRRRPKRRPRAQIEPLLPRVKKILENHYGDRLVSVILYGSFARDEATEDSDIDIAVVLKGEIDKSAEIDRANDALYDLEFESEELITAWAVSETELQESEWPLYYWIRTEGIKI